jgi:hypothetical protein
MNLIDIDVAFASTTFFFIIFWPMFICDGVSRAKHSEVFLKMLQLGPIYCLLDSCKQILFEQWLPDQKLSNYKK